MDFKLGPLYLSVGTLIEEGGGTFGFSASLYSDWVRYVAFSCVLGVLFIEVGVDK